MSRQQSVLRNTVGYMLKNIDNQATNGEEKSKPEVIKLGLDLHARQVTECRQLDGSTPKPAQQWNPWKLLSCPRNNSSGLTRSSTPRSTKRKSSSRWKNTLVVAQKGIAMLSDVRNYYDLARDFGQA